MTRDRAASVLVLIMTLVVPSAAAKSATASLSGVVLTADSPPRAVARAIVTVTAPELAQSRGAVADDEGRFRVDGLPAGRFTIKAEKPGFITSMYGAKRPARPGTAVALRDGESVNVTVTLWPGAVLSGSVRDPFGRAIAGVAVRAYRDGGTATAPVAVLTNNGAQTDSAGQFRIFGLEPGSYVLAARPGNTDAASVLADRRVDELLSLLQRGQRTGFQQSANDASESQRASALTFYPGTPIIEQARVFTVNPGSEIDSLNFTISSVPVSAINGVVRLPDGSPAARATVRLMRTPRSSMISSLTAGALSATAANDGSFSIANVAPGNYHVAARYITTRPSGGIVDPLEEPMWATAEVSITSTDVTGLGLVLSSGVRLQGQVKFERDGSAVEVPADVNVISIGFEAINTGNFQVARVVKPDGTFVLTAPTGELVRLSVLPRSLEPNWAVRSAIVSSGADWLDEPQTFAGDGTVTITLSNRRTELSGTLRASSGAPASDVFVIAFSSDRRFWGVETRRVQAVRPSADGLFTIKGLPAGEYFVGALVDVDAGDWMRPGFLESVAAVSGKVTIVEGSKTVQDLQINRLR